MLIHGKRSNFMTNRLKESRSSEKVVVMTTWGAWKYTTAMAKVKTLTQTMEMNVQRSTSNLVIRLLEWPASYLLPTTRSQGEWELTYFATMAQSLNLKLLVTPLASSLRSGQRSTLLKEDKMSKTWESKGFIGVDGVQVIMICLVLKWLIVKTKNQRC